LFADLTPKSPNLQTWPPDPTICRPAPEPQTWHPRRRFADLAPGSRRSANLQTWPLGALIRRPDPGASSADL